MNYTRIYFMRFATIIITLIITNNGYTNKLYDKQFVESSNWVTSFFDPITWEIIFKDGKFKHFCNGECAEDPVYGSYKIEDKTIELSPIKILKYSPKEFSTKTLLNISEDNDDLIFLYKISSITNPNKIFWKKDALVPNGSKRTIGNITVETVNVSKKIIRANSIIRKLPTQNSNLYSFSILDENNKIQKLNYLPKGRMIFIIARTTKKEKINSMNDFWYYCFLNIDHYLSENGPTYGWIYGGLIIK